ncbi:MAG: replicative DNA helicase [Gemmatimonadota bacterium]
MSSSLDTYSTPRSHELSAGRDPYRDRTPPYSEAAEQAVLSAMLLDAEALLRATEYVDESMFYRESHRRVFRAMLALSERGEVIDPLTLTEELSRKNELEAAGGREYIAYLVDVVPTAANVEYHAKIVREKALRRRLIEVSTAIVSEAFDSALPAAELLDAAEHSIFEVNQSRGTEGFTRVKELMYEAMERIEQLHLAGESVTGVSSGFHDLDELTAGFQPSELVIIAARPSMGKCLAHDSEIVLEDGSVETIEAIFKGTRQRMLTLDDSRWKFGLVEPSAYVDDGMKPVFRVTTRLGRSIETTITHPFRTITGWQPLGELAEGDSIAVPREIGVFGTKAARPCEVKLLGYLLGDGTITGGPPRFTNSNPVLLRDFGDAVGEFGGVTVSNCASSNRTPTVRVRRDSAATLGARAAFSQRLTVAMQAGGQSGTSVAARLGVSAASVSNWKTGNGAPSGDLFSDLCEFVGAEPADLAPAGVAALHARVPNALTRRLCDLGIYGADASSKHIPRMVFTLPKEQVSLFLNRLFATDGWATVLASGQAQLGYTSASERMARQVQHLLLRFGVIAALRRRKVKYLDERREAWQIDITDARAIERFAAEIGMFGKEEQLGRAVAAVRRRRYQTNPDLIPRAIWSRISNAKHTESWASLARRAGAAGHTNMHVGTRSLSRDRLATLARPLADEHLTALAESDVYWDEIVSIEPVGMKQVYDLTIPDTHNFVANDICVHNTAFVLNIAQNAALDAKTPVAFFSLEMSKQSLLQRMLTSEARVDAQRLRKGKLRDDEFVQLGRAAGLLSQAPVWIDDTPAISLLEMRSKARRLKAENDIGMIVVDYLQLMQGPASSENRQQEISTISRSLKALARELRVPVIALSQLSRAPEQRAGDNKRPQLSDLRESGAIEQDADVVMFLYRQEYYDVLEGKDPSVPDKDGKTSQGLAEVIIGKQRNGPTGNVTLFFNRQYTRFENYSGRQSGGGQGS